MVECRKGQSALFSCAGILLLAAFASQEAHAQSGALRGNPVTLEYNAGSLFQPAGIYKFLTSSWGQLYWIVGSAPLPATLELDTGGGSSVNVGVLNQQVVASGGFVYLSDMVNGPDGAIWLTGGYNNSATDCGDEIFRLDAAGDLSIYPLKTCASSPTGITAGSDGALWFTQLSTNQIGRITTAGVVTAFTSPCGAISNGRYINTLQGPIISGSDGNLWFWCAAGSATTSLFYKMTTSGQFTAYALPADHAPATQNASGFSLGADGNIWFPALGPGTAFTSGDYLGNISPAGAIQFYPLPPSGPNGSLTYIPDIVAGPDGALWTSAYYESQGGATAQSAFVRVTTSGQASFVPIIPDPAFANFLCQPVGTSALGLGPDETIVFASGAYSGTYSCYVGRLHPGATSLWPGTTTTGLPSKVRALAKSNRATNRDLVRPAPADGSSPTPGTCGAGLGCYLSVFPQNAGTALACQNPSSDTCHYDPIALQVTVRYSSFQTDSVTIGVGIGTDADHQYGTCTGGPSSGGTQTIQIAPRIFPVPAKSVTLLPSQAEAAIVLNTVGPGFYKCTFEIHIAETTNSGRVTTYQQPGVTVSFNSVMN
jgi:streptogramin lyase